MCKIIFNMSEKFALRWNDFHTNVSKSFGVLRNEEYLHDVTLVTDDHKKIPAHKLVLSASSDYFRDIFRNNLHSHPLVCLPGISDGDLKNIMDYIYNGEVQMYQDDLDRFLNNAQRLKLSGLDGNKKDNEVNNYDSFKDEFMGIIDEVEQSSEKHNIESNVTNNKAETFTGTMAVAATIENRNSFDDQVLQYLENCSDGSFRCTACGKTSDNDKPNKNTKYNMKKHIETHLESLSYPCPFCEKICRNRDSLAKHKSRFHKY